MWLIGVKHQVNGPTLLGLPDEPLDHRRQPVDLTGQQQHDSAELSCRLVSSPQNSATSLRGAALDS
jgi:hypothetical protein